METFVKHTHKSIDQVQNITPLKKLEIEYDDIKDKLLEIEGKVGTPEYQNLFDQLENASNEIDIILKD